jgi:pimeloyl-ACP methyl ester carboxylesterase
MATFVLVHGAWHGGWAWAEVVAQLRSFGHQCIAPDLPGLGDDARNASREIDLANHLSFLRSIFGHQSSSPIHMAEYSFNC